MNRILVLSANPINTTRIRLDEEVREIEEGLKKAQKRDQFDLKTRWAIRPKDMHTAILEEKPNIIHFSGHGAGQQGLILEDKTGHAKVVETEALSKLFKLFSDFVECVILNACYSEKQADAIIKHIPYVVGMSHEISDKSALEFSTGFYDALGAGENIDFAFEFGCSYIRVSGGGDSAVPRLRKSDVKPKYGILTKQDRIACELKSERGIDYKKLRSLLKAGKLKKADIETCMRLLELSGRTRGDWLRPKEIKNFPITDIQTIDKLWQQYSKGKFGFTPQKKKCLKALGSKKIKKSLCKGGTWESYLDSIGWMVRGYCIDYKELTFCTSAPRGHLPAAYMFSDAFSKDFSGSTVYNTDKSVALRLLSRLEP